MVLLALRFLTQHPTFRDFVENGKLLFKPSGVHMRATLGRAVGVMRST